MNLLPLSVLFLLLATVSCSTGSTADAGSPADSAAATAMSPDSYAEIINSNNEAITSSVSMDSVFFIAQKQVALCEEFADKYTVDPRAPQFLDFGAKAAKAAGQYEKAIKLYDRIIGAYSEYPNLPEVMFNKAFILDEDLNRDDEAKQVYTDLIRKYPNHQLSKNAKGLLELLYLTDEEVIRKLTEKKM
jgi:tetratricopeptide (TPR) repeat protein